MELNWSFILAVLILGYMLFFIGVNGVDVLFNKEKLPQGQGWELEIRKAVRESIIWV